MARRCISVFSILLSIAVVWVAAVPVQLQAGTNILRRDLYGPATSEFLDGYLEDHDAADLRDSMNGATGRRNDFDFPRRTTFDRIHGLATGRRQSDPISNGLTALDRSAKRNIDEIDRTAFDNFFKRNLDEIDRVGWSGFVKRLDDYLAISRTGLERGG
ncbi:orcokinin peptides isoform X2 [Ptiloglossa arizonensis]|uniref:orcokinin peptides isoform X2 n=1 Tax=Ptiloglossa arizonensis TaxID=3350558 RepID=UPI003FA0D016